MMDYTINESSENNKIKVKANITSSALLRISFKRFRTSTAELSEAPLSKSFAVLDKAKLSFYLT